MRIGLPLRDKLALSLVAGVLGTLVMYTVGLPLFLLDIAKSIYLVYVIEIFVTPGIARTTLGMISGMLVGLIVGGTLAFVFKLILEWIGTDWLWLKAVVYGALMWFIWVGIMRNFLEISQYLQRDLTTNMILLLQSTIYILATTYFMTKLSGGREFLGKGELR